MLIYRRVDQWVSGDAGTLACDSSGLYTVSRDAGVQMWRGGNTLCSVLWQGRTISLDSAREHLIYVDLFEQALISLNLDNNTVRPAYTTCETVMPGAAVSRSGARVAFVGRCSDADSTPVIYFGSVDGDITGRIEGVSIGASVSELSWSPDNRRLALTAFSNDTDDTEIVIVDVTSGEVRVLAEGSAPSWSPDGQWIGYLHSEAPRSTPPSVQVVKPNGRERREVFVPPEETPAESWLRSPLIWSQTGRSLAVSRGFDVVGVEIESGRLTTLVRVSGRE